MLAGMLQANNPFLIIIAGLLIGLVHAFEPDHIGAMSTQLIKNTNKSKKQDLRNLTVVASLKGALWGAGHTSSIILIGLLIAGLSLNIPDNFFISAEVIVGFSNGISHTHPHTHNEDHKHGHKAYLIGCIHGVAGSGSLVALTAATMNGFDMMIYFLILFGIGSIIGMTVASGVIGLPFIFLSKVGSVTKYLRYVIASITFIIGINIIFSIGLNSKLFSFN